MLVVTAFHVLAAFYLILTRTLCHGHYYFHFAAVENMLGEVKPFSQGHTVSGTGSRLFYSSCVCSFEYFSQLPSCHVPPAHHANGLNSTQYKQPKPKTSDGKI